MTLPGNAVAVPNTSEYGDGLEDINRSDLTIPRLKIDHKGGVLKDGQTGQEMPEVFAIVLGLVKQRILWHTKVESDERPMCKSPDYNVGFPNLDPASREKAFPWERAGFDPRSFPADPENGLVRLPCEGCKLKDWGSHPLGDKPYCSEQYTLPLMFATSIEELRETGGSPALFTVQKSGVKPTRNYLSPFAQRRTPVYSMFTKIGLRAMAQGTNPYAVPTYASVGATDQEEWPTFSEAYHSMRAFLQGNAPRGAEPIEAASAVVQPTAAPVAATATVAPQPVSQPVPQAAPVATPVAAPVATPAAGAAANFGADDDLPF